MAEAVRRAAEEKGELVSDCFVDVAEAAKFLGLSRAKLYALMEAQEVTFAKFGKSRRIPRKALFAFAERCIVGR